MKPGIYKMTDKEYHAIKDRCSSSQIKSMVKSAKHFKDSLDNPKESESLSLGSVFHKQVLEPEDLDNCYVLTASTDKRTKIYREAAEKATLEAKELVSEEDFQKVFQMAMNVQEHSRAGKILELSDKKELVVLFEWNGVPCKAKLDGYSTLKKLVTDLKSTRDASEESFRKDFVKFGYHIQGAFYTEAAKAIGLPAEKFLIIACENSSPFCVNVFELSVNAMRLGRQEVERLLPIWASCMNTGVYPGYSETITILDLPAWEMKKLNDEPKTENGLIKF